MTTNPDNPSTPKQPTNVNKSSGSVDISGGEVNKMAEQDRNDPGIFAGNEAAYQSHREYIRELLGGQVEQDWLIEVLFGKQLKPLFPEDDDLPEILAAIQAKFTTQNEKLAKAYGGCVLCYGKGYATQESYFVARGNKLKQERMKFCTCARGKQLRAQFERLEQRHLAEVQTIRLRDFKNLQTGLRNGFDIGAYINTQVEQLEAQLSADKDASDE